MSSADMRATEPRAAAWARAAEMSATTEVAAAAAEMCTAEMATTATEMSAAATAKMAAASTAATASLRRGSRTDQTDRQNNGQDIEFRHGTLEARGLRREGGDQDARAG